MRVNFAPSGEPRAQVMVCEPPWWRVGGYALVAAAVVAFGLAGDLDRPGRLLVLVVGAGALGLAGRDALMRPTLRADAHAVTVLDGMHHTVVPWTAVRRVSTRSVNRRGLVGLRSLELDVLVPDGYGGQQDQLVVLSRRMLGADPTSVAEGLERLRTRAGHAGGHGPDGGRGAVDRAGADDVLDA
ncbi:MAG: PH domain-containing protein [Frankiaceae bacterium]